MTSRVNLADLLLRRVSLDPREAATLTLAVAREWDRQRSLHGPIALPDLAGIELTDSGTVVFLVIPRHNAVEDVRALAELLGQLLGVDDDRPRHVIPGGLLITMSGQLGHLELPSSTLSGFQAALGRFADNDPDALRTVYWRAASRRRPKPSVAATVRGRRRERRRLGTHVSELRRSIRTLERQVFEAASAPAPRPHPRQFRYVSGAIAAVVLAVMATGALIVGPARQEVSDSPSTAPVAPVERAATTTGPRPLAPRQVASATATSTVRGTVVRRPAVRSARVAQLHDRSSVGQSAGGTRGIAWLIR